MKFEDTQLLDHPTVRKAYEVMRSFYANDDAFAREAVKGGELISHYAKKPDPDAVAAAVLQGGMTIPYSPETFTESVGPGAVAILKAFKKLHVTKPVFNTEGERQFMLALNVGALERLREKILAKDIFKYKDTKKMLEANERTLEAAAKDMDDQQLADVARARLDVAHDALEDLRQTTLDKMKFEKSGLPEHPTVKKSYALIRADETKYDPLFTNRTELGAGTAKMLFETGASTDPDVLGAAILNQYVLLKGHLKETEFLADELEVSAQRAKGLAELHKKFPARLVEIYLDTSPLGLDVEERNKRPVTEEARLIEAAMYVYRLESTQQEYIRKKQLGNPGFDTYAEARQLELIEDFTQTVTRLSQKTGQPGLKSRMEKSVAAATAFMNEPSNVAVRKPGSPRMDYDW
jgi:hypothetical protein